MAQCYGCRKVTPSAFRPVPRLRLLLLCNLVFHGARIFLEIKMVELWHKEGASALKMYCLLGRYPHVTQEQL